LQRFAAKKPKPRLDNGIGSREEAGGGVRSARNSNGKLASKSNARPTHAPVAGVGLGDLEEVIGVRDVFPVLARALVPVMKE